MRLLPTALAALLLPVVTGLRAEPAWTSYDSRAACEQADKLTSEQCGFAFRNARAEFDEKAPRYRGRQDCQRAHKQCSAQLVGLAGFSDLAKSAAIYVPSFKGVAVAAREGGGMQVLPRAGGGAIRFKPRKVDSADERIDGRVTVVPDSRTARGRHIGNDPQSSGPYVRRGDRDDTIKTKLQVRDPNDASAVGLFVDKNGVEWYRPARRR